MKNKPNFFLDNRGFPNWGGGGGPPLGNFSHIIPFFSLIASLTIHVAFFLHTLCLQPNLFAPQNPARSVSASVLAAIFAVCFASSSLFRTNAFMFLIV